MKPWQKMMVVAAFALTPLSVWAQSGTGQDQTQQSQQNDAAQMREQQRRRQEELNRRLNFTDDQKKQWVSIQRQTNQQIRAVRKDDSLNEQQMQEKLKAIHKENRAQVLAMLTPEQQEELKKWWEEQRAAKRQQETTSDQNSQSAPNTTSQGKSDAKDDDFFAGMVQDPEPAPKQAKKH